MKVWMSKNKMHKQAIPVKLSNFDAADIKRFTVQDHLMHEMSGITGCTLIYALYDIHISWFWYMYKVHVFYA